jgi:hypothetical protein
MNICHVPIDQNSQEKEKVGIGLTAGSTASWKTPNGGREESFEKHFVYSKVHKMFLCGLFDKSVFKFVECGLAQSTN